MIVLHYIKIKNHWTRNRCYMVCLIRIVRLLPILSILFHPTMQASPTMLEDKIELEDKAQLENRTKLESEPENFLENKYHLNTEALLDHQFSPAINRFWNENAKVNTFESIKGGTIHTIHIATGQANAIVISQGRNESTLKYKELAFELNQQGYDVFLIDHRGQGLSTRLGGDAHRGHVQAFQDYVLDLTTFVETLQLDTKYQSRFLLSHSMGGTISALYLQQKTHPFQASAFFSPMFSINLGALPTFLAKLISYISDLICTWFSDLACYAPGSGPYFSPPFEGNSLTSSEKRYHSALNTFEINTKTQLGGPSMRWVNESLYASEKAIEQASKIDIPMIIVQAGADSIVKAEGQQAFFANNQRCEHNQFIEVINAKHELLLEQDKYRIPAIAAVLDFFKQSQQGKLTCTK